MTYHGRSVSVFGFEPEDATFVPEADRVEGRGRSDEAGQQPGREPDAMAQELRERQTPGSGASGESAESPQSAESNGSESPAASTPKPSAWSTPSSSTTSSVGHVRL